MIKPISTGSKCLDEMMGGGLLKDGLTMIYGEPETGKTTLLMQCAANCAKQNLKTLFIDCDDTFSPLRLKQITSEKFSQFAQLLLLIKPQSFSEQATIVDHLSDYITRSFGLVAIDTFNSLYRLSTSDDSLKTFELSRELNRQMANLSQISKEKQIPIVLTSQVKSVLDNPNQSIAPVAHRVLKFWAKKTIALTLTENPQIIEASLEDNHNTQEASCYLRIAEIGIRDYDFPY